MGRHFCVSEGNLYIFTTGGEFLLDLNVFPGELNLFEAEVGWKLSPWIAVAEDVLQRSVDRASIILQLNDYSYMQVSSGLLEDYFRAAFLGLTPQAMDLPPLRGSFEPSPGRSAGRQPLSFCSGHQR